MKKGTGIILAFGLMCFSVGAASGVKISAVLKSQNINYKGVSYNKQVIEYKGSNYVPLRAFSEMTGISADYKNGIIYLGENTQNNSSQQGDYTISNTKINETVSTIYDKANPIPVGTTQKVQLTDDDISFSADICVKQILRGDSAWKEIQAANMFNEKAKEGKEYILAKISIKVGSMPQNQNVRIAGVDFYPYNSNDIEYDQCSAVAPLPMLAGTLSSGSSLEGWTVFEVDKIDTAPKVVYGADGKGEGGAWLSLK